MSKEQETKPKISLTPLSFNSVQETIYWAQANLPTDEHLFWEIDLMEGESYDLYDYFLGMTQIRQDYDNPSDRAKITYQKGFIFMLEALHQEAKGKNLTLKMPEKERIDEYFYDELLNSEYNRPQIDEVRKQMFTKHVSSVHKFAGALKDMRLEKAGEILIESISDRTKIGVADIYSKETHLVTAFQNEVFKKNYSPITPFVIGASDAYHLFTPTPPKTDIQVLNRMWDIGVR